MWHSFNKALNLMNNEQWLKQYRNIYSGPNIALYTLVTDLTNLTNQYLQEAPNCVQISEAQVKCDRNSNMLIWNWKKNVCGFSTLVFERLFHQRKLICGWRNISTKKPKNSFFFVPHTHLSQKRIINKRKWFYLLISEIFHNL